LNKWCFYYKIKSCALVGTPYTYSHANSYSAIEEIPGPFTESECLAPSSPYREPEKSADEITDDNAEIF